MHLIKRTVSLFSLLLGLHRDSKITVNWERHERAISGLWNVWWCSERPSYQEEMNQTAKNYTIFIEKYIFYLIQRYFTSVNIETLE